MFFFFFSLHSKQVIQTKLSSLHPAAGTAKCPEVAQCHSLWTALGGWDPQLFAGHLLKGESRHLLEQQLMENQPCVGMVPQLIPSLQWDVQALMKRGMRGSPPRGRSKGWDISHKAEQSRGQLQPRVSLEEGERTGGGADGGRESLFPPRTRSCSLRHLDKPDALLGSDLCKMSCAGAWCTSSGPWRDWVVQLHQ